MQSPFSKGDIMKLTLPTALLAAGLTLFSVGYAKNNNASMQPEPAKTATLETLVSTQHSEEQITFAQHQKEIRQLVNYYIARIADRYDGDYINRQGNIKRLQVIFDDEKAKKTMAWQDQLDRWVNLFNEQRPIYVKWENVADGSPEKSNLGKKIDEIQAKMERIRKTAEKISEEDYWTTPPHLEPEEFAIIKYDLEKNVFYLIREFSGQEMFYVQDIGSNGLQINTKDFVRTAKDLELPYHSFEGPAICNKEAEWKQDNARLSSQYVKEVHHIVKVLGNRWAGKYGFPAK